MRRTAIQLATIALTLLAPATAHPQWELQNSNTQASLRGIHNVGGGVAWASGTDGTVLRTEDGGYLWQGCATPPGAEHLDFRGIQAFDENTAIVMSSGPGDQSRLYKTTDGCRHWTLLFTNPDKDGFWDALQFVGRDRGVLLGDPVNGLFAIFLSFDGGNHWERQKLAATADVNGEGAFAASNSSMLLEYGLGYRSFCTGGPGGPRVVKLSSGPSDTPTSTASLDSRTGWSTGLSAERLPVKGTTLEGGGCFSLAVQDRGYGNQVAVGGDYHTPTEVANTAWTTANMVTKDYAEWHSAQTPPHGYRSSVAYDPTTKTWITVGPNGSDYSTDDGRNWHPLGPTPEDQPGSDRDWNALSLPFVIGPHGRIGRLRTDALPGHSTPATPKPSSAAAKPAAPTPHP